MKIKKYKLVREPQLIEFEKQLNKHLKNGWQLYGNLTLDTENYLYQSMILTK